MKVELEQMPPTDGAAYFHSLRVHLQIMQWKLLEDGMTHLKPHDWGWKMDASNLNLMTDKAV